MEKVIVHCPLCTAKIRVSNHILGKTRSCPKCKERIYVQLEQVPHKFKQEPIPKTSNKTTVWTTIPEDMLSQLVPVEKNNTVESPADEFAIEFKTDTSKPDSNHTVESITPPNKTVSIQSARIANKTSKDFIHHPPLLVDGLTKFSRSFQAKRTINFLFSSAIVLFLFYSFNGENSDAESVSLNTIKPSIKKTAKRVRKSPKKTYKKHAKKNTSFSVGGSNNTVVKTPVKKTSFPKKAKLSSEELYQKGRSYDKGIGVTKNYKTAAYWFQQAAELGHVKAQYNIGNMYEVGEGVSENKKTSAYWYEKAAAQGDKDAQSRIGYYYNNGIGVRKNMKLAVHWFEKAASQGDSISQNNLGAIYYNGDLGYKNIPKAYKLLTLSAKNGNKNAIDNLKTMRINMANRMFGAASSGFLNSNSGSSGSSGSFDYNDPDDRGWLSQNYQRLHGTHK